jgi:hypothetical protein
MSKKSKKSKARKTYHIRGFCRNLALAYRFIGAEGFESCEELNMALKEAFEATKREKIRTGCNVMTSDIFKSALYDSSLIKPSQGNISFLRILIDEDSAIDWLKRYTHIRRDINGFLNSARVLREFYHDPELHSEYQRHKEQYKR